MSAAVDTMDYKLPYKTIFGGVSAFSKVHFEVCALKYFVRNRVGSASNFLATF